MHGKVESPIISYPSSLHQIRYHYNDMNIVFPDHSPKTIKGWGEWTLGPNVGPWFLKPINVIGIDVVYAFLLTRHRLESDSSMINYYETDLIRILSLDGSYSSIRGKALPSNKRYLHATMLR